MSRARVYCDVNETRPREYWDYETLNVTWGYVLHCHPFSSIRLRKRPSQASKARDAGGGRTACVYAEVRSLTLVRDCFLSVCV